MIYGKDLKTIFTKHREEIIALLYAEQPKPKGWDSLALRYTDKKGRQYKGWERDAEIPTHRYAKVLEFIQLLIKGISPTEYERLLDHILDAAEKGATKEGKHPLAKISAIAMEMKMRMNKLVHLELCYNVLAVQIVRQDEDPYDFSNQIHLEKVDTLMEENKDGSVDFFFQMHELKRVRDLFGIPKEDWQQFINEYQHQTDKLNYLLEITASKTSLKESEPTLTK